MSAAHTPGPWVRDRASGLNCDVRGGNNRKVALCWGLSAAAAKNADPYRAECDANAVLIAAAPDLLAAARQAESLIPHLCDVDGSPATARVVDMLHAAIAKAIGGTA